MQPRALPPAFLFKREWRKRFKPEDVSNIDALGPVNVVFHVVVKEDPETAYDRILYGTSALSPPVNNRQVLTNEHLQLLSCTDRSSAFIHVCIKCTGQHGKILRFQDYLIRIGRWSLAQALLNVIRFLAFSNTRCYTGLSAPNMVITGTFSRQLDRASLITDPQAVENDMFPGISINLRSISGRGTPGLHTRNPSKFIIPGCRDLDDLVKAIAEINSIAARHFVCHKRKPEEGEGPGDPEGAQATPADKRRRAIDDGDDDPDQAGGVVD